MIGDMMDVTGIEQIDHIGIAVRNLEEAVNTYADNLGLELEGIETIDEQGVKVASFVVGGVRIELVQPTEPDSPIGRFIEKRGEGMHHIALRVGNIDEALGEFKAKGMKLIDETPRIGAHGTRIAFLHPKAANGVLMELVERHEG